MNYHAIKLRREDGSVQVVAIIEHDDNTEAPNALALYEGYETKLAEARRKAEVEQGIAWADFDHEAHSFEDYLQEQGLRCVSFTTDTIFE